MNIPRPQHPRVGDIWTRAGHYIALSPHGCGEIDLGSVNVRRSRRFPESRIVPGAMGATVDAVEGTR